MLAGAMGPMQATTPIDGEVPPFSSPKPGLDAGFTFLGQFIDHDLTEFRVVNETLALVLQNPALGQRQQVLEDGQPITTTNGRSGRLDLDSVYGLFGDIDLELFDEDGFFKTREVDGRAVDIVRDVDFRDGRLIADPRNDENKIVVQLHILFMRLHNELHIEPASNTEEALRDSIAATRSRVVSVYRRVVLYDYLPRVADPAVVLNVYQRVQDNKSLYQKMNRRARAAAGGLAGALPADAIPGFGDDLGSIVAMPVEFAHAVFRLGHSQLRNGYAMTSTFNLPLFATGQPPSGIPGDPRDLRGNEQIANVAIIEWDRFFGGTAQPGEPLDAFLPASVFRLPPPAVGEPPVSLAERNIRRGVDFGLPSGQECALALDAEYDDVGGVTVLQPGQIFTDELFEWYPEFRFIDASLSVTTPLWFYILQESAVQAPTESHLGSVGSYIVAETILGSLAASEDFDLEGAMTNYLVKVATTNGQPVDNKEQSILAMRHLLKYLGEPTF